MELQQTTNMMLQQKTDLLQWAIRQLMMMGIGTYGFTVGIPSPLKLGPWAKNNRYYYAPWETMADILGGVNQRYGKPIPQQQIKNAWMYYAMSTICFPLTVFYWL